MTLRPLPEAAVARFRGDVERLVAQARGAAVSGEPRLALAVSGGADSMAMLRLAAAGLAGRITVATFDHRLRAGSGGEAALVGSVCAALAIPHQTLTPFAPITGNSVQMRARTARYAALGTWARGEGAGFLLTAHHADDQAETLLMRLQRASGLSGLAGIRAVRFDADGVVLRPLLDWRRAELRALASESATPFVDDPSNDDPRHDRTRIRALLAATPALDPVALAASAGFLAEAEEVLVQSAERLWAERWRGPDSGLPVAGEPRDLRRRLVRRALAETRMRLGIGRPSFDADSANVEALLDALAAGRAATHGGVMVRSTSRGWVFCAAPPRRSL
ncbi:tRNA lysidine(34) synthetase TilS [Sphingomonas sp. 8AM]|uniref:tRNA lysidine(34) synthetase TilS n=1 Tax=Sphingomonas sp. 8AM TaxID=2653170 RepID=UPI0012F1A841|nr:tRNA lysidine(34) synthetase TilS [Sphingomonas sp. 8AM]VXC70262.1 tRNA(Ile)-lysidine synthase [Sphingomonas sp. 8AM]